MQPNNLSRFKTKKSLIAHFSQILNSATIGEPLNDSFSELVELLHRHPDAREKLGSGAESFHVGSVAAYNTRCFVCFRTDGSEMTFSYRACINGSKSNTGKIKDAFRSDVIDQIVAFKHARHASGLVCEITGTSLGYDDADIDHTPPMTFASIMAEFITDMGLSRDNIAITLNDDGVTYRISDPDTRQAWKKFHRSKSNLRVLSKRAHKSVHAANNNKRISNAA